MQVFSQRPFAGMTEWHTYQAQTLGFTSSTLVTSTIWVSSQIGRDSRLKIGVLWVRVPSYPPYASMMELAYIRVLETRSYKFESCYSHH